MSATIDQQFIEYIVKAIVGNPDAVVIERTIDEKGVLLQLTVDGEDLGRVIGKRGSGAQALRTLLRALGTKNDARYNLKIVDVNGERPAPREDTRQEDNSESREENTAPVEEVAEVSTEEEAPTEEVAEAPEEEKKETVPFADDEEEPAEKEDDSDTMASRTRKELADLDDLDI